MPLDNDQIKEIRRVLEQKREDLAETTGRKTTKGTTKKTTKKSSKKKAKKKATPKKRTKKTPLEAALSHELNEVESALKRLKTQAERYGYCEHCFMEIPWAELVANPARRFCSRCS